MNNTIEKNNSIMTDTVKPTIATTTTATTTSPTNTVDNSATAKPIFVKKKPWTGKKICLICKKGFYEIDYKQIDFLKKYVKLNNKIISRKISGNCFKHQRQISNSIKRARLVALLPFVLE